MDEWSIFRAELIKKPQALRHLCAELGISFKMTVLNPNFGGMDTSRVLTQYSSHGFNITVEIDDDDLSPAQKKLHYTDLADKCIKALKQKGVTPSEARANL